MCKILHLLVEGLGKSAREVKSVGPDGLDPSSWNRPVPRRKISHKSTDKVTQQPLPSQACSFWGLRDKITSNVGEVP